MSYKHCYKNLLIRVPHWRWHTHYLSIGIFQTSNSHRRIKKNYYCNLIFWDVNCWCWHISYQNSLKLQLKIHLASFPSEFDNCCRQAFLFKFGLHPKDVLKVSMQAFWKKLNSPIIIFSSTWNAFSFLNAGLLVQGIEITKHCKRRCNDEHKENDFHFFLIIKYPNF